ncbi:MAG: hypothetical protein AAB845_01115, partial [Patescibacteria group bacterium]
MDERIEITGGSPIEGITGMPEATSLMNKEQVVERAPEQKSERMGELLKKIDTHTASLQTTTDDQVKDDATSLSLVDEEERITRLLSLADTKGVIHAVSVARQLEDLYALDMFRDTLIE